MFQALHSLHGFHMSLSPQRKGPGERGGGVTHIIRHVGHGALGTAWEPRPRGGPQEARAALTGVLDALLKEAGDHSSRHRLASHGIPIISPTCLNFGLGVVLLEVEPNAYGSDAHGILVDHSSVTLVELFRSQVVARAKGPSATPAGGCGPSATPAGGCGKRGRPRATFRSTGLATTSTNA